MAANIETFGILRRGETVDRITIGAGDLRVSILTLGAIVQSVRLAGTDHDLTLGSDRLADYEAEPMCYNGAVVAPVVNRLTDAAAPLGDKHLTFQKNFNGRHILHSGDTGTHAKIWTVVETTDSRLHLALDLPDGEGGFPGNRRVDVTFEVSAPASLRMTIAATSDADTLWNAANHSYWNLDGSNTLTGHTLRLAADHYLPCTPDFIPTGEIRAVSGMFDFRKGRALAPHEPDLDNSFCLSNAAGPLRDTMWLQGGSGLQMTVATTEPGIQLYDYRHDGFKGLAVEAQGWPDAPNKPDFPSIFLPAGEVRQQITEWRFAKA